MRCSAAMPVLASSGLAAVNWMSESVANAQSSLPLVVPSGENSGSGRRSSSGGLGTSAEVSTSTLSKMIEPLRWLATLVSMAWKIDNRTGNFVEAGNVHSRSFQPARIGAPSGPLDAPSAFR